MKTININLIYGECNNHTDILRQLQDIYQATPDDQIILTVNLDTPGQFLYADMLLVSACLIADLRSKGYNIKGRVQADWASSYAKYASRINFFETIGLVYPEDFKRHENEGRFREISAFSKDTIKETFESLNRILGKHKWIHRDVLQLIYYCLYEIMDNVLVHSKLDHGWVCAQSFETKNEIRLIISDTGQGIHQALSASEKYSDVSEPEALELCIQRNVTNGEGLGFGLFATSEFIRLNNGDMLISSGHHSLSNISGEFSVRQDPYWQGTLVFLRINTDTPVDYHQIMPPNHTLPDDYQTFINEQLGISEELW